MEKTVSIIVISLMIILAFLILYGKNGFMDVNTLKMKEDLIINENIAINEENRVLERKIARLKSDLNYIDYIARHELGMVAKDELVFRFENIAAEKSIKKNDINK